MSGSNFIIKTHSLSQESPSNSFPKKCTENDHSVATKSTRRQL